MTTRDSNTYRMARTVKVILHQHEPVWNEQVRFALEAGNFTGIVDALEPHAEGSLIVTKGASTDKDNMALEMYRKTADIAQRVSVYALDTGNMELHDQLRVSRNSLASLKEVDAFTKVKDIYNRVMPILSAVPPAGEGGKTGTEGVAPENTQLSLPDYAVNETEMSGLKTIIDTYDALLGKPRDLQLERKRHNQTIPELMKELRKSLYKLDSLINIFAGTDFYTDYKNARITIDRGGSPKKEEEKK
ncbi:hypothetical protein [Limibacterium fermenti]|uniref:hypothetical protein n=1 Tax=Limibacterium fermenti TaxID=3229863 RepID=UPI002694D06E